MILKDFPEGLWKILQDHGSSRWDSSNPIIMMRGGASDDWICGRIQDMAGDLDTAYLAGLPADQRAGLERVNAPGVAALRSYLNSGQAVAFLGAGASAPLYPLWGGLIAELMDATADRLTAAQVASCRELASSSPDAVVEIVRRGLGAGVFREVLRRVLRPRSDPVTGRAWTEVQE